MNIFAIDLDPVVAAQHLPDKLIVKMPTESAQMIALIFSEHYFNIGRLYKKDGTPYSTERGTHKNHPCTIWAAISSKNLAWLYAHAFGLCDEYRIRYEKVHAVEKTLHDSLYHSKLTRYFPLFHAFFKSHNKFKSMSFVRAMPDSLKNDLTIDDVTAYRKYLMSKSYFEGGYTKAQHRKPNWKL
jgi:hypothetical protein